MKLCEGDVTLRDYVLSDVEDEIKWLNEDTCWMEEDTPWLSYQPVDGNELREAMTDMINNMPENAVRWRLEIEKAGKHIGFVSSYFLNKDFSPVDWEKVDEKKSIEENNLVRFLSIEICEEDYWGKGIGKVVLGLFMDYFRAIGENEFYIETWSGNGKMIKCASKIGFEVVKRDKDAIDVYGVKYDNLIMKKSFLNQYKYI